MENVETVVPSLKACSSGLRSLNRSTEDDFLAIGGRLKEVSARSGEVAKTARSAAGLISGGEVAGCIGAIQDLFDNMYGRLRASRNNLRQNADMIKAILDMMDAVTASLSGFTAIVKRLSVLSVSTKIEASRLRDSDGSFAGLARDIEVLSTAIGSKSGHILGAVESLRGVIGDILSQAGVVDASEHKRAKGLLDDVKGCLSSLREKHALSSKTACFVADRSEEISAAVSEIVSSLQFHDITRQQIEHAADAIDELCGKISAGGADEELSAGEVCAVLSCQLSSAKGELVSAMDRTLAHLRQISGCGADIAKEVTILTADGGSTGASFLSRLKAEAARIISFLKENGQANSALVAAVEKVVSTTGELSGFIGEVEDVGQEIELIALNARIKAARAGAEGAPLSVLAEAIRSLSENARRQSASISGVFQKVGAAAGTLGAGVADGNSDVRNEAAEKLGELFNSFGDMDGRITAMVGSMERSCGALEADIGALVSGTTVQKVAEQALGVAVAELNEAVRAFGPPQSKGKDAQQVRRLEDRYTMSRERSIHRSVFAGPPIDPAAETGLGDNVELF